VYVPLPFSLSPIPCHAFFAKFELLYDLQAFKAAQERTQAVFLLGRAPRPLARPSRVLDHPPM
jgi:hypothetical protein